MMMVVVEMRILMWMCVHILRDFVRNDNIQDKLIMAIIEDKMRESILIWSEHVYKIPLNALVRNCERIVFDATRIRSGRVRDRLKKSWEYVINDDILSSQLIYNKDIDRNFGRIKVKVRMVGLFITVLAQVCSSIIWVKLVALRHI